MLGGDMASTDHRDRAAPRIAYMPQGLGRNLYPTLSAAENIDFFGSLFGLGSADSARNDRLLRATGLILPGPPGRQAVGRDEAEAVAVLRPGQRPGPADPGRAHHRRRSPVAPAVLAPDRRYPGRPAGHDRAGRHRLHGGGRALRAAGSTGRAAHPGRRDDGGCACTGGCGDARRGFRRPPGQRTGAGPRRLPERPGGDGRGRSAGHSGGGADAPVREIHRRRSCQLPESSAARFSVFSAPMAAARPRP